MICWTYSAGWFTTYPRMIVKWFGFRNDMDKTVHLTIVRSAAPGSCGHRRNSASRAERQWDTRVSCIGTWWKKNSTKPRSLDVVRAIQDFKRLDNFNYSRWTKLSCVILLQNCFSHAPVSISWCECSEIFQIQKAEQLITPQYLLTVVHICIIYI